MEDNNSFFPGPPRRNHPKNPKRIWWQFVCRFNFVIPKNTRHDATTTDGCFFGSTQLIKLVLDLSCRTLSCNLRRGGGMHVAQNNRWWMMYTKAAKKEKIELLRLKFLCGLFSPQNLWLSMAIDDAIPLENHQWKHRWGSKFTLSYNICIYLSILSPKSYWCLLNVGLLEGLGMEVADGTIIDS